MLFSFIAKYAYFCGSLVGLIIFALLYRIRKDLRQRMLRTGIACGVVGVLSEHVFFRDYWHPPLLFRIGSYGGIEDFFFGLFFGGVCVALYDTVFHKRLKRKNYPHYWIISVVIVSELLSILILTNYMNSIYSSAIGFLIPAVAIVAWRRDLIVETLLSALLGASLLVFMEMIMLLISPHYLQKYYLLYGKVPLIFGIVPLTEFFWGASFAALFGPLRDFELGYMPVSFASRSRKPRM